MQEKFVRSSEMSSASYVDDAADFAKALTRGEMLSSYDYGDAMRRLARKINVGYSTLKRLNYDRPKTIGAADFARLGSAYGKKQTGGGTSGCFVPRTALGRFLVGAADALDSAADALDRPDIGDVV